MNIVKRIVSFVFFVIFITTLGFSQENNSRMITLEISNVNINKGTVYIAVSKTETSYKKREPDMIFYFDSTDILLRQEIRLPFGDYVIQAFQDTNSNQELDSGLFNIPKEPVGISNWDGKSIPGNFNKHKIVIDNTTQVIRVNLHQL